MHKNSFIFLVLLLIFAAAATQAQEKTVNVISETEWHQKKVDVASMNKRISDVAEQYKEYAPIPRIAFYDIGYPKDKFEFEQLNGYGILLISAMSQSEEEFPIKRVYAALDGKEIELKSLKQFLSKETNAESQIVKTFGLYRMDALYLFPVYLRNQRADLLIDFAKNRNGMKIAAFDGETPEDLSALPNKKPSEQMNIDEAIKRFIKREYPGFFETNKD